MPQAQRNNRKERVGIVISDKMDKTISVQVKRTTHNAMYEKAFTQMKKLKAHDEKNEAKAGDEVRIRETRPLSKTKRWTLVEIVKKAL